MQSAAAEHEGETVSVPAQHPPPQGVPSWVKVVGPWLARWGAAPLSLASPSPGLRDGEGQGRVPACSPASSPPQGCPSETSQKIQLGNKLSWALLLFFLVSSDLIAQRKAWKISELSNGA